MTPGGDVKRPGLPGSVVGQDLRKGLSPRAGAFPVPVGCYAPLQEWALCRIFNRITLF
jgi:hypothetical protein